jgi:hypothetical protein
LCRAASFLANIIAPHKLEMVLHNIYTNVIFVSRGIFSGEHHRAAQVRNGSAQFVSHNSSLSRTA